MSGLVKTLGVTLVAGALTFAVSASAQNAVDANNDGVAKRARAQAVAQNRTSVTVFPRSGGRLSPNAKRHCEAWLREDNTVHGKLITPQMRCWWQ